ncbi:hypothetical protein [Marinobacter sp. MIT932201]|uniref:hypothetical protein n=1 Tax=Marinobacter sp. MIT932201 TaxID=3096995 RepID=UPI00399B72C7
MIKAKWLYSELPISLAQLSNAMKDHQYTESSGFGFLLTNSSPSKLVGKYIEKLVRKTLVEDPFGHTSEIEVISYYVCQFNWSSKSNYMYISEPPRSLRKFSSKLHDLTGLGLVLSEVNVAPDQWIELIESNADYLKILKISSYGIRVSQNSTAKISVAGGSDVRDEFSELVSSRRYLVDSVKFEAGFSNLIVNGELTKTGVCRLKSANAGFILEKLRDALESSSRHIFY